MKNRKVRLDLMMRKEIKDELKDYCNKNDISISEFVEYVVRHAIRGTQVRNIERKLDRIEKKLDNIIDLDLDIPF